jgi:hypothetical protein
MNAQAHMDPPPCKINYGVGPSLIIPVDVKLTTLPPLPTWAVSSDPIVLRNDLDEVRWNLWEVFTYPWEGPIQDISIEFFRGPLGYIPALGPFLSVKFDFNLKKFYGIHRNHLYGDCYCYNLWVTVLGQKRKIFPTDPQMDSMAPPPDPYGPDGGDGGRGVEG